MKHKISRLRFITSGTAAVMALTLFPRIAIGQSEAADVDADDLVENIELYIGQIVSIHGDVAHVCPVNGIKLKLKTMSGNYIKVVPDESLNFDKSLNKQHIHVMGMVLEERVPRRQIMQYADKQTLLCHIDHTPCINAEWVKNVTEKGNAPKVVEKTTKKLTDIMQETGKDYVSVVKIVAASFSVVA